MSLPSAGKVGLEHLRSKAIVPVDNSYSIKAWLTTAQKLESQASSADRQGDLEQAYISYHKFLTVVIERIPNHRDFESLAQCQPAVSKQFADMKRRLGQEVVALERISKVLQQTLANRATNDADSGVDPEARRDSNTPGTETPNASLGTLSTSSSRVRSASNVSSIISEKIATLYSNVKDSEKQDNLSQNKSRTRPTGGQNVVPNGRDTTPLVSVPRSTNVSVASGTSATVSTPHEDPPPQNKTAEEAFFELLNSAPPPPTEPPTCASNQQGRQVPYGEGIGGKINSINGKDGTGDVGSANQENHSPDQVDFESRFPSVGDIDSSMQIPSSIQHNIQEPSQDTAKILKSNPPKNEFSHFPPSSTILPSQLYEYLQGHRNGKAVSPKILILDVRPAENFAKMSLSAWIPPEEDVKNGKGRSSGSLQNVAVVNIDPVTLRDNITTDGIDSSLMLSSESSRLHFSRRNEFDLVVYYDEFSHVPGQTRQIANLVRAIYEMEFSKILKRGPLLLVHGWEGWKQFAEGEVREEVVRGQQGREQKTNPSPGWVRPDFDERGRGTYNHPYGTNGANQATTRFRGSGAGGTMNVDRSSANQYVGPSGSGTIGNARGDGGQPMYARTIYEYFQHRSGNVQSMSPFYPSGGKVGYANAGGLQTSAGPALGIAPYAANAYSGSNGLDFRQPVHPKSPSLGQPLQQQNYIQSSQSMEPQIPASFQTGKPLLTSPTSTSSTSFDDPFRGFTQNTNAAFPKPLSRANSSHRDETPLHDKAHNRMPTPQRPLPDLPDKRIPPEVPPKSANIAYPTEGGDRTGPVERRNRPPSVMIQSEEWEEQQHHYKQYYSHQQEPQRQQRQEQHPNSIPIIMPMPPPRSSSATGLNNNDRTSISASAKRPPFPLPNQTLQYQQYPPSYQPQPQSPYPGAPRPLPKPPAMMFPAPPLFPPRLPTFDSNFSQLGSVSIGKTGLKNMGNTCFMNSILQCLSGTIPLARYFLDGSYKKHFNRGNKLGTGGVLAEAFADLLRTMWSDQYTFITPTSFRDAVGRFVPHFKSNEQQDSQEFLAFVLDGVHEDLNLITHKPPQKDPTPAEDEEFERLPDHHASQIAWDRYTQRNASMVVSLFQGQLRNRLTCDVTAGGCGKTSTSYNAFMYLSLPIPMFKSEDRRLGGRGRGVLLSECMDEFVKSEVLDGDDRWNCPRCKTRRRSTKSLTLSRLPDVFLVHLKRFSFQGPFRDKLETFVDFPVRGLDMSRYMPSYATQGNAAPYLYDLYAVSNHFGGLNGGHYTSMVRNGYQSATWHNFDDSRVSVIGEGNVVTKAAYILCYVRSSVQ